jgi:formate hydrogenlyase subunit 6/NADH:ubiquinone oxidoreductase subunit I
MISREEALRIADVCDEAGLVPQPTNSKKVLAVCNCCGDCCGVLRSLKKLPRPAELVLSNYYAEVDPELCTACETCLGRCQMDAITMEQTAAVDTDRCIGCGLCVTTCPSEALSLRPKPPDRRREPPEKFMDTMMEMARTRGKSLIPISFKKS